MIAAAAWVAAIALGQTCDYGRLAREERWIAGPDPSIKLFTMTVRAAPGRTRRGAVVFTHGAGSGGSASWDLAPASGVSSMRFLACRGFDAYAFDARGFGGSTMPESLSRPEDASPPLVRAETAALDLASVVRFAVRTSSAAKVALVGWSWGSDVAGMYAGRHPEAVDRLVLVAPVWDRRWPARHIESRAWYAESRAHIEKLYAPDREERAVFDAFVAALFRFNKGDVLRLPAGPYRDLYGEDAPVWDASKIVAKVTIIRGDEDKASLEPHAHGLFEHLVHAKTRRYQVLGGLGHFLFREKRHADFERALAAALED